MSEGVETVAPVLGFLGVLITATLGFLGVLITKVLSRIGNPNGSGSVTNQLGQVEKKLSALDGRLSDVEIYLMRGGEFDLLAHQGRWRERDQDD